MSFAPGTIAPAMGIVTPYAPKHGVLVAVAVGVLVGPPGVAVGPAVPSRRKTWSGTPGSILQVVLRTPQALHAEAKPPPGFCQAAALLDCTVRSVQPNSPVVPPP